MLPDDVFRARLEEILIELERWAGTARDCADIEIIASERYWRMAVKPYFAHACPFELLLDRDQTFALSLNNELYDHKPIERFDLFFNLATAIALGHVAKIETRNALTGVLIAIAMRVEIADGWDWIGSRTVIQKSMRALEQSVEFQTSRFLPYRR